MATLENDTFNRSLIMALKQNFEHARHIELQRQQQLYIFIALLGVVLTFIFGYTTSFHLALQQFWPVFLFLTIYSYLISSSITKWNVEFKNHLRHIQWVAEKLGIIIPISNERQTAILNSDCKYNKEALIADAMSQGYLALSLPLPKQVKRNFELITDIILGGNAFAFSTGLLFYINSFYSFLPNYLLAYPLGLIFAVALVCYDFIDRKNMCKYADKVLDSRQPDEITLFYQGKRPFYEDTKKVTYATRAKTFQIIKLSEVSNQNRWIIGTPPAIEKTSPFYSANMQINHVKSPNRLEFLGKENAHKHSSPIEELYLVINGTLDLKVADKSITVKSNDLLIVHSNVMHQITNLSDDVDFLVIRSPPSNERTKTLQEIFEEIQT